MYLVKCCVCTDRCIGVLPGAFNPQLLLGTVLMYFDYLRSGQSTSERAYEDFHLEVRFMKWKSNTGIKQGLQRDDGMIEANQHKEGMENDGIGALKASIKESQMELNFSVNEVLSITRRGSISLRKWRWRSVKQAQHKKRVEVLSELVASNEGCRSTQKEKVHCNSTRKKNKRGYTNKRKLSLLSNVSNFKATAAMLCMDTDLLSIKFTHRKPRRNTKKVNKESSTKIFSDSVDEKFKAITEVQVEIVDGPKEMSQGSKEFSKRQRTISAESDETRSSKATKYDDNESILLKGSEGGSQRVVETEDLDWNESTWAKEVDQNLKEISLEEKCYNFVNYGHSSRVEPPQCIEGNDTNPNKAGDINEMDPKGGAVRKSGNTNASRQQEVTAPVTVGNGGQNPPPAPLVTSLAREPIEIPVEMVLAPADYPNSVIDERRQNVINDVLTRQLNLFTDRHRESTAISVMPTRFMNGVGIVICPTKAMELWLRAVVAQVNWRVHFEMDIRCVPLEGFPMATAFSLWLPGGNSNFEHGRRRATQEGVDSDSWRLTKMLTNQNSQRGGNRNSGRQADTGARPGRRFLFVANDNILRTT